MYGVVRFTLERKENALTLPASALITEGGKTYVYTVVEGKAKRTEVKTGFDDGIRVEITEGLTGNEPVVISGRSTLKDGTPVKVAVKSS